MSNRTRADHMGMLATAINALAVADVLEQKGVEVRSRPPSPCRLWRSLTSVPKRSGTWRRAGWSSSAAVPATPFFSTDTAAVLRAAEIDADVILLAKNIDGVYSADPKKDPSATKYSKISYDEVLAQHLAVMDTTATSLSMDNKIPVLLFALKDPENIIRVVMGEEIGTIVGG